jgi:hypothetical protein
MPAQSSGLEATRRRQLYGRATLPSLCAEQNASLQSASAIFAMNTLETDTDDDRRH